MSPIWIALGEMARDEKSGNSSRLPRLKGNLAMHTRRVATGVAWVRAFVQRRVGHGELSRTVSVTSFYSSPRFMITADASPWGLGAWLAFDGYPIRWLASEVTSEDASMLGVKIGDCSSQAVLEALAMLVALRTWFPLWAGDRMAIVVRSDSMAALGALGKMASPAKGINIIARELALDVA